MNMNDDELRGLRNTMLAMSTADSVKLTAMLLETDPQPLTDHEIFNRVRAASDELVQESHKPAPLAVLAEDFAWAGAVEAQAEGRVINDILVQRNRASSRAKIVVSFEPDDDGVIMYASVDTWWETERFQSNVQD